MQFQQRRPTPVTTAPPLTPSDADLQDFPFMPLHVARLRDSDLANEEHPEACWYAVLLWSVAWHQLPAGSLPDNEVVLCKLMGLGRDIKTFRKHRAGAMRGWIPCSDGRLYHPVVAEQVAAAWDSKLRQRHRTLCASIRKHNERSPDDKRDSPSFEQWLGWSCPATLSDLVTAMSRVTDPDLDRDKGSKGQGERQGQGDSSSDADASGGEPPVDPDKVMFDAGLRLLAASGMAVPKARPVLGKWKRDHGAEAVIVALGKAQREGAIDPVSFITKCLEQRNGHGQPNLRGSRPDPAIDMFRAASAELEAERASGDQADDLGSRAALPSYLTSRP
jgi:hypothetical protein